MHLEKTLFTLAFSVIFNERKLTLSPLNGSKITYPWKTVVCFVDRTCTMAASPGGATPFWNLAPPGERNERLRRSGVIGLASVIIGMAHLGPSLLARSIYLGTLSVHGLFTLQYVDVALVCLCFQREDFCCINRRWCWWSQCIHILYFRAFC